MCDLILIFFESIEWTHDECQTLTYCKSHSQMLEYSFIEVRWRYMWCSSVYFVVQFRVLVKFILSWLCPVQEAHFGEGAPKVDLSKKPLWNPGGGLSLTSAIIVYFVKNSKNKSTHGSCHGKVRDMWNSRNLFTLPYCKISRWWMNLLVRIMIN